MSVISKVRGLVVRMSPSQICDNCIATALNVEISVVIQKINELAAESGYDRRKAVCGICNISTKTLRIS
jgi:hypothetical protein